MEVAAAAAAPASVRLGEDGSGLTPSSWRRARLLEVAGGVLTAAASAVLLA